MSNVYLGIVIMLRATRKAKREEKANNAITAKWGHMFTPNMADESKKTKSETSLETPKGKESTFGLIPLTLLSPLLSLSSPSNLTNYFPPSLPLLFLFRPSLIGLPSSSSSSSIPGRAAKKWWKERESQKNHPFLLRQLLMGSLIKSPPSRSRTHRQRLSHEKH